MIDGIGLWENIMDGVSKDTLELGPYFTHQINSNIRHITFAFSRYKFAARMLGDEPKKTVLELGCNEGIGTLNLAQVASSVIAIDFEERAIKWATDNLKFENLKFICDDFLSKEYGKFDSVVSIDVIEHIDREKEDLFLDTIIANLNDEGFAIVGTPNITSSEYASEASKIGHINLYDGQRLKNLFLKKFKTVFLFGMNDEVMHTGFLPMCHYIFVVACNKK